MASTEGVENILDLAQELARETADVIQAGLDRLGIYRLPRNRRDIGRDIGQQHGSVMFGERQGGIDPFRVLAPSPVVMTLPWSSTSTEVDSGAIHVSSSPIAHARSSELM